MSNWFASIGTASSGINAARYGLDVVTQNITNADTDGYVQRRANQVSVDGGPIVSLYSTRTSGTNLYGGTRISSVDRVTDPVLDARVRDEHSRGALSDTNATVMSDIEGVLPEPGDDGVAGRLDDFWKSWGSLANNPDNAGTRTAVLSSARALVLSLNSTSRTLDTVAQNQAANLTSDVDNARAAAGQLADLNGQIAIAAATGQDANGLLDRRDQLLDTLGKLVGGVATINANGSANVTVGGQALVTGNTAAAITVSGYGVQVAGNAVTLTGGSAAGRVTALTTTIPSYQAKLDAVADAVVAAGNQIQSNGRDSSGAVGAALFSGSGAGGITVALTDPSKLAAASLTGGALDGSNALAASQRGTAAGGPDALYSALVGTVAADSATATQVRNTQATVVSSVDSLRTSITGVSFDDEMSKMLTYQRAFQASSRALTTIDSLLDTLINHTGVGA